MKKIIIAMAAIAAVFTMASCNKEPLVEQEENTALGNCIIAASTESNLTKTALSGNDTDGYDVVWSEGDTFKLRGETFTLIKGAGTTSGTFQGYISRINGYAIAYYPVSYDGSNWPAEQTYTEGNGITGSPMEASVNCFKGGILGEKIEFKNVGGILRLTVKGRETIKSIKVFAKDLNDITLNCGAGVALDDMDGTVFHIAMPEGKYSGVSIMFTTVSDDRIIKKLKAGTQLVINPSEITAASFKVSIGPNGALPGRFSVAEGKQVQFSQGNLICDISDGTQPKWGFYENQYGFATGYSSTLISLFNWGYHPTESLYPDSTISNTINHLDSNYLPQDKDWGSRIGDGKTWRTLTGEEWKYLFETRTNAADKYGYATVGGVYGLIILPDSFNDPMKNGGSGAFVPKTTTGWNANVYTTGGNWEAMEAAGAVFLPAAGSRSGSSLSYVGSNGRYWSSSHKTNSSPYHLFFDSSLVNSNSYGGVTTGMSVRLVTNLYTVTFDMNGKIGTAPEILKGIKYGSKITKPSDPIASDYVFVGWYKEKECKNLWNFDSDVVATNITLYAKWVEGALPGKYTINKNGKQVFFSKGNLWRDNNGSFHFEDSQYDFNSGNYNTSHISHFMWSRNAGVACALKYNDPSASENDEFFTNADETRPNLDFTVNGQKGIWRTLSKDEWKYLIENNGIVWTTINGINGLIIFCDGYSGSRTGLSDIPEGCAFLPAAGFRNGLNGDTSVNYAGSSGFYWSASPGYNSSAYELGFDGGDVNPGSSDARGRARSVRLVTESNQ